MTKWQYCEMTVEYGGPLTGVNGTITWWNEKGEPMSRQDKLGALMVQLGQQGWEMVSTSLIQGSALGNRRVVHMFKRPIQE